MTWRALSELQWSPVERRTNVAVEPIWFKLAVLALAMPAIVVGERAFARLRVRRTGDTRRDDRAGFRGPDAS